MAELVAEQFPQWRDMNVTPVQGAGTVNAIFRIGSHLSARFPLVLTDQAATRQHLEREADAARELLGRTRFDTPEPLAFGEPGVGYPGPWAVQTWLPGSTAAEHDLASSSEFAHDLADFVCQVRELPTLGRNFSGTGRGGDLPTHDRWMEMCFERSVELLDVPRLRDVWLRLRSLPRLDGDAMTHGDLIPANLVVIAGRLTGVLDVGGLGAADPAVDLVGAWHALDDERRQEFRAHLGCSALEWARGKAWAFEQAMGLVWYYVDTSPPVSAMGRRTLDRILANNESGINGSAT